MKVSAHLYRPPGRVGLDWMMVTVLLIAALLVTGAVVRTENVNPQARFGAYAGGLLTIAPNEALVAYETYDATSAGWDGAAFSSEFVGLGGIVGPMALDETLTRTIDLPAGTTRAVVTLDLIALDDWSLDTLTVAVNGADLVSYAFSTRPDEINSVGADVALSDGVDILVETLGPARERGFAANGPEDAESLIRVRLSIEAPGEDLAISIGGTAGEASQATVPQWALDNLLIVAETQS